MSNQVVTQKAGTSHYKYSLSHSTKGLLLYKVTNIIVIHRESTVQEKNDNYS